MINELLNSWERRSHCENNFGNAVPRRSRWKRSLKWLLFESRKQRYSKYPDLLAGFQGFPSKRREGKERKGRERGINLPNGCLRNLAPLQTQQ